LLGKAVDIVDGDEVGWGHHQPLPTDENPITTQIINDAVAKAHEPAKTEAKTGGHCFGDKMKLLNNLTLTDIRGKIINTKDVKIKIIQNILNKKSIPKCQDKWNNVYRYSFSCLSAENIINHNR
jgi:hypothetical protein